MSIQYTTNLAGKPIVKFNCPKCNVRLTARLTEAGNVEKCGDCGAGFKVPGEERLKALRNAEQEREKVRLVEKAELEQRREEEQRKKAQEKAKAIALEQQKADLAAESRLRHEQQRIAALKGANLNLATHDWSGGAPYCYDFVQTAAVTGSANWFADFVSLINKGAENGWEYFRCEDFTYVQPAGCLGALFGASGTPVSIKVVVFRKPAILRRKEMDADQPKWH